MSETEAGRVRLIGAADKRPHDPDGREPTHCGGRHATSGAGNARTREGFRTASARVIGAPRAHAKS